MTERKYLKDVLPRLYDEVKAWADTENEPELLRQVDHLFITGRCPCGQCSDFFLDSDIPELSRANGSEKLLRPLYYDLEGVWPMVGMTENADGTYNITGFELSGSDYEDGYINSQLEANGWPRQPEEDGDDKKS